MQYAGAAATKIERREDSSPEAFARYLAEARTLAKQLSQASAHPAAVDQSALLPPDVRHLRWFVLPSEAAEFIRDPIAARARWAAQPTTTAAAAPITPLKYLLEGPAEMAAAAQKEPTAAAASSSSSSTPAAATTVAAAAASSFSLIAPTTSAQPVLGAVAGAFVKGSNNKGQKRGAAAAAASASATPDSAQDLQQLKDAKKQRKSAATAASIAAKSAAAAADANGDIAMQPAEGVTAAAAPAAASSSALSRTGTSDDFKDDVCKNCWHVHWNAQTAPATAAAAAASSASAGSASASSDASKQASQVFTKECTHCECIHFAPRSRRSPKEVAATAQKIQKHVGAAIRDFGMICEGDKVLIGISGGKDSLSLFHILRNLQRKAPIKFDIGCVTVDPQTPEYDPSPLKRYFAALGVPYYYESQPILAMAKASMDNKKQSICSFCARMKRGIIYTCMRREGYNVLALGQHLDDLAESLLMSVFHNGLLRTMKANYHAEAGDIRIIRPLIYVRERLTREYSNGKTLTRTRAGRLSEESRCWSLTLVIFVPVSVADLPVITENCPACFEAPKERQRIKLLLAGQEHVHANLFSNMLKSHQKTTHSQRKQSEANRTQPVPSNNNGMLMFRILAVLLCFVCAGRCVL